MLGMNETINKIVEKINLSKYLSNDSKEQSELTREVIKIKADQLFTDLSVKLPNYKKEDVMGVSIFVACNMYFSEPLMTQKYFSKYKMNINKALNYALDNNMINETFVMNGSSKKNNNSLEKANEYDE
jgi:hypothetical protein